MSNRPNVLLVLTDQQRVDTLGFRTETPCRTPNIDSIAARGISFDRAITPCPLCLPSRASLFTGLYPTQNDMMDNSAGLLTSCQLLDCFRDGGYGINYAGKWHMGEGNIGEFTDRYAGDSTAIYSAWCEQQGLTDGWMFNHPKTRTTRKPSMSIPTPFVQDLPVDKTNEAYVTDMAIDMLRTRKPDAPFFQVCSYNGPHPPFMIPEPYFSMYDPADVPAPPNFGPQPDEPTANRTSFYRQLFNDHGTGFDAWRQSYAVYWGFVTMIDDMIGRLLVTLEEENLTDKTIILFASDHGECLGAHGLWHKMVPYEESVRVPLLMQVPDGLNAGIRSDAPASLIDVAPTLAGLCGLPPRPEWHGQNLVDGNTKQIAASRPVFAVHKPLGEWMQVTDWRMVIRNDVKYVWNMGDRDELFDLSDDPFEVRNLIDDPDRAGTLTDLRSRLRNFLEETGDPLLSEWPYG